MSLKLIAGLLAGLLLGIGPAAAQADYPTRPITLIVPFAAGGPTDVVARIIGETPAPIVARLNARPGSGARRGGRP